MMIDNVRCEPRCERDESRVLMMSMVDVVDEILNDVDGRC